MAPLHNIHGTFLFSFLFSLDLGCIHGNAKPLPFRCPSFDLLCDEKINYKYVYNVPWVLWKGALAIGAGTAVTVLAIMSRACLTDHPNHVCPP